MAETWVLNEEILIADRTRTWSVNFTSNGITYTKLTWHSSQRQALTYDSTVVFWVSPVEKWLDQAYRTITFDAAPTGDLLTFLQANAVKQIKPANKVVVNGETILDLTQDSVTPSSLLKGITAHDKSGAQITGTMEASAGGPYNIAATTNSDGTQNLAITDAAGGRQPVAETWVLNNSNLIFPESDIGIRIPFSVCGVHFGLISFVIEGDYVALNIESDFYDANGNLMFLYNSIIFEGIKSNNDFNFRYYGEEGRTLRFYEAVPDGDFKTWLQANATKL